MDRTRVDRRIADLGSGDGPLLVAVGAIHGNEPAGMHALRRVCARIQADDIYIMGRFVALVGNTAAAASGERFCSRDLNRAWTHALVGGARHGTPWPEGGVEERELAELVEALDDARRRTSGIPHLLDLHTTSGGGAPFAIPATEECERILARRIPVPIVHGLIGRIIGPMIEWAATEDWHATVVEAGRHTDESSIHRHEAAVWLALAASGCLHPSQVPDLRRHITVLRHAAHGTPRVLEVFHRHQIGPDDGFIMEPGWRHFQPVHAGDLLARDRGGEVHAPSDGILLMPLYQGRGTDGFFLGRAVDV
jgi:succinylglutamate desuccinylase